MATKMVVGCLGIEDFISVKFYCPHALADGKQHIKIREKTLDFSSTGLSTANSLY